MADTQPEMTRRHKETMESTRTPVQAEDTKEELHVSSETEDIEDRTTGTSMREWAQYFCLCYSVILAGFTDASTGPLLPRIQEYYNVEYTIVSMIFIFNCLGFIVAALANMWLSHSLGFGKCLVLGAVSQAVGYALMASAPGPFPAFVLGFFFNGFGMALQNAQSIGYVAAYRRPSAHKMGFLTASYGIGALVAPSISTQFANSKHWSYHYLVAVALCVVLAICLAVVLQGRSQYDCLKQIDQQTDAADVHTANAERTQRQNPFMRLMRLRAVHLLAAFLIIYIGTEVTVGGWTVTFIIKDRGGGSDSGYISTGFFAGLFVGRIALTWVNAKLGNRLAVFIYTLITIGLDVLVWQWKSLIGDSVAVAFMGFFLGPMYPITMNVAGHILPPTMLSPAIGWITAIGNVGSALLPFATGALASAKGIWTLQPFILGCLCLLAAVWACVPTTRPELVLASTDTTEQNNDGGV